MIDCGGVPQGPRTPETDERTASQPIRPALRRKKKRISSPRRVVPVPAWRAGTFIGRAAREGGSLPPVPLGATSPLRNQATSFAVPQVAHSADPVHIGAGDAASVCFQSPSVRGVGSIVPGWREVSSPPPSVTPEEPPRKDCGAVGRTPVRRAACRGCKPLQAPFACGSKNWRTTGATP